eukprot:TRINITY_DN8134_c0_g1_i1.p1 TRINITY_DN8134_c0_g1~~TRINITY_DN8134_c0_g1_i1.p1  ORF type:complete len:174 (+),score=36.68 TRINITY_DN8134_c0_g1_i1:134-655(+)
MGIQPSKVSHYDLIKEGDAMLKEGRSDEAIERLSGALEMVPDYWVAYIKRARAYRNEGMLEASLADATMAVTLHNSRSTRELRRDIYNLLGDTENANLDEVEIMKLAPKKDANTTKKTSLSDDEVRYWALIEEREKLKAELNKSSVANLLQINKEVINRTDPQWVKPPSRPSQ